MVEFTPKVALCILLAWACMIGRDFGLTWRFHALTEGSLSWSRALRVDMLCEFTSCITPSAVGGSAFGMFYLNREGIEFGRATTLMMSTLFLDELFFVVACPIVALIVPYDQLFGFSNVHHVFTLGLQAVFWCVYGVLTLWTLILFLGIFIRPDAVSRFLRRIFRWKWLRRWESNVEEMTDNMISASQRLRSKGFVWWLKAFTATALSWSSRFAMVGVLFFAFVPGADHLVVFGRQIVIWVVLMCVPTPGGSGVSEWLFTEYYGDMLAGVGGMSIALVIALFWRLLSYYIYLLVGVCLLPGFFSRLKNRSSNERRNINLLNNG